MTPGELKALPALRGYSEKELEGLLTVAIERVYGPGEMLCVEGSVGRSCFVLVHGDAEVLKSDPDAPKGLRVLAALPAGSLVGQIALVDHEPRSASIRAKTEVTALEIERDTFEKLLSAASAFALRFQEQIAVTSIRQLRRATERILKYVVERGERAKAKAAESAGGAEKGARATGGAPPPASAGDKTGLHRLKAAASEWSLPIDMDEVEVARPGGTLTAAEAKARTQKKL